MQKPEHSDGAGMIAKQIAALAFDHVSAIAQNSTIEAKPIRHSRFEDGGVAQRPVSGMEFMHPAPRVTADIGGVVPSAVVHDAPAHELLAGIVRVAIVVEKIGYRESTNSDAVAIHGTLAGQLVWVAAEGFSGGSQGEILREIQSRQVGFR